MRPGRIFNFVHAFGVQFYGSGNNHLRKVGPLLEEAAGNSLRHYRCVGIGVGPANLSLASLLYRHSEITNLFLDKKESFGWHDGQQIPESTIQVSMLKDLVSLSDPASSYSFLSYLHELGRIYHYVNAQFDAVPRQEFRNYMEWASRKNENVVFGQEVLSVDYDNVFRVRTSRSTVTADNIVRGRRRPQPTVPPQARPFLGDRQFHVSEFLTKAGDLGGMRVGVVGGGQSGAEAFLDLISRNDGALPRRVIWISRRPNYFPLDDSPFTNDFYMPSYSDYFAEARASDQERLQRAIPAHQRRHLRGHAAADLPAHLRPPLPQRALRSGRALPQPHGHRGRPTRRPRRGTSRSATMITTASWRTSSWMWSSGPPGSARPR